MIVECYQNRRFDSDFLTVQKVIESGKLGDLLELEMHFDYYRPEVPESVHEFSTINRISMVMVVIHLIKSFLTLVNLMIFIMM